MGVCSQARCAALVGTEKEIVLTDEQVPSSSEARSSSTGSHTLRTLRTLRKKQGKAPGFRCKWKVHQMMQAANSEPGDASHGLAESSCGWLDTGPQVGCRRGLLCGAVGRVQGSGRGTRWGCCTACRCAHSAAVPPRPQRAHATHVPIPLTLHHRCCCRAHRIPVAQTLVSMLHSQPTPRTCLVARYCRQTLERLSAAVQPSECACVSAPHPNAARSPLLAIL